MRFFQHKGCGSRLKQQYVYIREDVAVERSEMVKGYEFETDHYAVFEPDELKALEDEAKHTIDIVSFMPAGAVNPIYFDKTYYLGPDKRGGKPYNLLAEAMRKTGTCALAQWVWKGKQYVVQVRANDEGLVLQQLLYADEVRSMLDLHVEKAEVQPAELALAKQLIEQNSVEGYDPMAYKDEEKDRILAAINKKIAGKKITVSEERREPRQGAEVIDLMEALRASMAQRKQDGPKAATAVAAAEGKSKKTGKRATAAQAATPAKRASSAKK
nr:Ku protein [Cupriavidus basilensis]